MDTPHIPKGKSELINNAIVKSSASLPSAETAIDLVCWLERTGELSKSCSVWDCEDSISITLYGPENHWTEYACFADGIVEKTEFDGGQCTSITELTVDQCKTDFGLA